MKTQSEFDIYWSPEGRKIARVQAENERKAIRKVTRAFCIRHCLAPYNRYRGEMYAVKVA